MPSSRQRRPLEERFWLKVAQSADGCWLWTACCHPSGYGLIGQGGRYGRSMRAHRVSYELAYGPIPAGLDVLHRCDNPPCVRPDHLFLGTAADNAADMVAKVRHGAVTHPECIARGNRTGVYTHPESRVHGERHAAAKVNSEIVRSIRLRYKSGTSNQAELAREFGVSGTTVSRILQGRAWVATIDDASGNIMASHRHLHSSGRRKLEADQVRQIRRDLTAGVRHSRLASQYGVDRSTISEIKMGRSYKWVSDEPEKAKAAVN